MYISFVRAGLVCVGGWGGGGEGALRSSLGDSKFANQSGKSLRWGHLFPVLVKLFPDFQREGRCSVQDDNIAAILDTDAFWVMPDTLEPRFEKGPRFEKVIL